MKRFYQKKEREEKEMKFIISSGEFFGILN